MQSLYSQVSVYELPFASLGGMVSPWAFRGMQLGSLGCWSVAWLQLPQVASAQRGSSCFERCVTPLDWTVDATLVYVFCSGGPLADILILFFFVDYGFDGGGGRGRFKLRPPKGSDNLTE